MHSDSDFESDDEEEEDSDVDDAQAGRGDVTWDVLTREDEAEDAGESSSQAPAYGAATNLQPLATWGGAMRAWAPQR